MVTLDFACFESGWYGPWNLLYYVELAATNPQLQ